MNTKHSAVGADVALKRWSDSSNKRWGLGERANMEAAQSRLLDAAKFCYERLGIHRTSMEDIALQARVTRPTVYRYFKLREDIVNAVLARELERFWFCQAQRLKDHQSNFGSFLVESLMDLLSMARDSRFSLLFGDEGLPFINRIFLEQIDHPGVEPHPIFIYALQPGARPPVEIEEAIEWFNRLAISFLNQPKRNLNDDRMRGLLRQLCPWISKQDVAASVPSNAFAAQSWISAQGVGGGVDESMTGGFAIAAESRIVWNIHMEYID